MSAVINEISIKKKFVSALKARKYVNFYRNSAQARLVAAKQDLLDEFDNHDVTKELLQDPTQEGSELVDHGNLVSFLGLPDGSLEVGLIREELRAGIQLGGNEDVEIKETANKLSFQFPVIYPDQEDIYELHPTPDNWHSKSWLQIIEDGIGNAASYIFSSVGFSFGNSRSGTGLQLKGKDGKLKERKAGGTFHKRKYISEIISHFKRNFRL